MILQALNGYYERLEADPEAQIAPYGFSRQKISFCIVLEPDGTLHAFEQVVSHVQNGRAIPQQLLVPGQSKPPGQGINPCFLWDNATYLLGWTPEGREPAWAEERFHALRQRHLLILQEIQDPALAGVCSFLQTWEPKNVKHHPELEEMTKSFGVFRIRGSSEYVHEREAVAAWWTRQVHGEDEEPAGMCLVTGDLAPIARLHEPKIKGVDGTQSSGAAVVSFNLDAFASYGKEQSYNAPVSQRAAFQYATALNRLLADRERRVLVGDATTVFWTEKPTPAEHVVPSIFAAAPAQADAPEDDETVRRVRAFLQRLQSGKADEFSDVLGDLRTPFYVLGLAPNASRIAVRYWMAGTLGELAKHLSRHVRDLQIVGLDRPPTTHELLRETAAPKKGFPDTAKIPNTLAGGLARAVLTGQPYPAGLYAAILRRIRCEGFAGQDKRKDWRRAMARRAAALKAYLIRNFGKEIPVSLDPERPEPAYQLGRWFAVLEKIQTDPPGKAPRTTIKDRFYTAASSTPAAIFPRLIQLSQHHLGRIDSTGLRITREKQTQEIAGRLDGFPRRLAPEDQGLFHLGYYHQTQALYTPKGETQTPETPSNESE